MSLKAISHSFIGVLILAGCGKDALSPCSDSTSNSRICREYRFDHQQVIDYIDYSYDDFGNNISKVYRSLKGKEKSAVDFQFISGQLIKESYYDADNQKYRYYTITYNNSGMVSSRILHLGRSAYETRNYSYDSSGFLETEEVQVGTRLKEYYSYVYLDDNRLRKKLHYNRDTVLQGYISYEYFTNNGGNLIREINFDKTGGVVNSLLYISDANGKLQQINHYEATGNLTNYEVFERDMAGRLEEHITYSYDDEVTSREEYMY